MKDATADDAASYEACGDVLQSVIRASQSGLIVMVRVPERYIRRRMPDDSTGDIFLYPSS